MRELRDWPMGWMVRCGSWKPQTSSPGTAGLCRMLRGRGLRATSVPCSTVILCLAPCLEHFLEDPGIPLYFLGGSKSRLTPSSKQAPERCQGQACVCHHSSGIEHASCRHLYSSKPGSPQPAPPTESSYPPTHPFLHITVPLPLIAFSEGRLSAP